MAQGLIQRGEKHINFLAEFHSNEKTSDECCCISPEKSLEVLWKFRPARVAGIHGDEDAHGGLQGDALI